MNRATISRKGLALLLGAVVLGSPAFAAGVDSRAYTCPELQRLILSNGFIFINNPNFEDFVVSDVSYCSGSGILQRGSVPTKDAPECVVNYCVSPRASSGGS